MFHYKKTIIKYTTIFFIKMSSNLKKNNSIMYIYFLQQSFNTRAHKL